MPTADGQLTAAEVAQLYALVKAQAAVREQITRAAVAAAVAPWRLFGGWFSSADIGQTVAGILRVVLPLQRRMAQVTDAYLARQLSLMSGRRVDPIGAVDVTRLRRALPDPDADPAEDRGYVDPMVVYGRAADTYRYLISEKQATPETAVDHAVLRAQRIAETDILLAMREQSRQVLVARRVQGWRRVLHPEVSKNGLSCGLCIVAADRVYTREELLPMHEGCNCEVMAIENGVDPGIRLNREDLARLYEAAGDTTSGRTLQNRVRAAITEHGELGPVLVRSNHHFRSPADVAASKAARTQDGRRRRSDQAAARRVRTPAATDPATFRQRRIDALEESIAAMERLAARGEDFEDQLVERRREVAGLRAQVPL